MKLLVFSDVHLTDKFDHQKSKFLKKIISQADQVIINGDFWDGHLVSFNSFVNSPWKSLFPLLKAKKAIYIYGNHDRESFCDKRVNLFSIKQTRQINLFLQNKIKVIIEHGDRWFISIYANAKLTAFMDIIDKLIVRLSKRKITTVYLKWLNKLIKRKLKKLFDKKHIYVCGHTHLPEIDLNHSFINSGCIRWGYGDYLFINENKFYLKTEQYQ